MTNPVLESAPVPAHVPQDLVHDIDVYNIPGMVDGRTDQDLHELWKLVQDSCPPVFWTPRYGGHWVVTRYQELRRLASEHETFSNAELFIPRGLYPMQIPTQLDPPEHGAFRKLLLPAVTPAKLRAITESARATAVRIIEQLRPEGRCEFVGDFAGSMPIVSFLSLIDLPVTDAPYLREIVERMPLQGDAEASKAAWEEMSAYVRRQIELRCTEPRDDLITSLINATVDGRAVTADEVFSMCLLFLIAGLDTTTSLISFAARFLALSPAHRLELRAHPERIDNAVEEISRRFGLTATARLVRHDTELGGVSLKADDVALAMYALGGLDETANPDPLTVDFTREGPRHVTFGHGPHACVGMRLAKLEIRIFLEEWLARIPDFHIAEGPKPTMSTGVISQVHDLNLEWVASA